MTLNKKHAGIVAIILIAILVAVLLMLRSITPLITSKTTDSKKTTSANSDYIAVNPSFGPLVQMEKLHVTFSNNQAISIISKDQAQKIKQNQDVVLYDKEGYSLPLGGKVIRTEQINNDVKIIVDLPEQTDVDLLKSTVDVITLETTASKRLPLTALVRDESEQIFVWRIFPSLEDLKSYTPEKLEINVGLQDQNFFAEQGFKIKSDDLIIINPDKNLSENGDYRIKVEELKASMHNPIRQAWIDLEIKRLKDQQTEMYRIAEECGKTPSVEDSGTQSIPVGTSNSCGASDAEGTDPFLIFQNLIGEFQDLEDDMP